MGNLSNIFSGLGVALVSIVMGIAVPVAALLFLFFSKQRSRTSFISVMYGVGTFLFTIVAIVIAILVFGQIFPINLVVDDNSDPLKYVYIGGAVVLGLFYLFSEGLKLASFQSVKKSDRTENAGITFGCGFVLAQNLLIFGLLYYNDKIDLAQGFVFGGLMMVSGLIYLILSIIGYRFFVDGQKLAGSAISFIYYLMFMLVLLISKGSLVIVLATLAFACLCAYVVLKDKGGIK